MGAVFGRYSGPNTPNLKKGGGSGVSPDWGMRRKSRVA